MKYEVAMQWADALESGEYKQGKHLLRDRKDNYCCLGVLCDISGLGKWQVAQSGCMRGEHFYQISGHHGLAVGVPHQDVAKWAGLTLKDPLIDINTGHTATQCNDDLRLTFQEIAALIRKNWESIK